MAKKPMSLAEALEESPRASLAEKLEKADEQRGELLARLAEPDPQGNWTPHFDKADVIAVLEEVVEEVAQNPRWVTEPAGDVSSHLSAIVGASLEAIAGMEEPRSLKG